LDDLKSIKEDTATSLLKKMKYDPENRDLYIKQGYKAQFPWFYILLAYELLNSKNEEAKTVLLEAIEKFPFFAQPYLELHKLHIKNQKLDEAEQILLKGLDIGHESFVSNLLEMYVLQKKDDMIEKYKNRRNVIDLGYKALDEDSEESSWNDVEMLDQFEDIYNWLKRG
jgi:tetratricopeptide (TPR) repeat protein